MSVIPIHPADERLEGLIGHSVPSGLPNTQYQVVRILGSGGMAVVVLALRHDPFGVAPAVLKILTPRFVGNAGNTATLSLLKEAQALSALNEQVPPTPYVVRLLDTGTLHISLTQHPSQPGTVLELGWLALEYIHGDAEGTTLGERVRYSLERTRAAFDPLRAADCLNDISQGLSAVHAMGILHRDVKPNNVLCSGFGDRESFKIADFGISRSEDAGTFVSAGVGTPGYTAPEQLYTQGAKLGPASDVFGLAGIAYFVLTGRDMFRFETMVDMVRTISSPARPSIRESEHLAQDLKRSTAACDAIDALLARSTSAKPSERPQTTLEFAEEVRRALHIPTGLGRTTMSRMPAHAEHAAPSRVGWQWLTRQRGFTDPYGNVSDEYVISAAFDGAQGCLSTTNRSLVYWDGRLWRGVPARGGAGLDAVHCMGAGEWLVASRDGGVHRFTYQGLEEIVRGTGQRYERLCGVMRQVIVLVSQERSRFAPPGPPVLHRLTRHGMLEPFPLEHFACVNDIARLDTMRWLVVGRGHQGQGLVAIFHPMAGHLDWVEAPANTAYLACATNPDHGRGIVVGTQGCVVIIDEDDIRAERMGTPAPLSVACFDPSGGAWTATAGSLYYLAPDPRSRWQCPWHDPAWTAPFASIHASGGVVLALTADGSILEGLGNLR
ncbi:MAG: serine/threonine protein kinase [Polyangiaceae bacterium]|nr:serine/threonine protein kinase [Polyangiaceae bacterium]